MVWTGCPTKRQETELEVADLRLEISPRKPTENVHFTNMTNVYIYVNNVTNTQAGPAHN